MQRVGVRQPGEEPLAEHPLVHANRVPAHGLDVLDRSDEAREELVLERSCLEPAAGRLVRRGPYLVRTPLRQELVSRVRQAEMRALGATRVSPHDACWDRVPSGELERLANAVFRAATRRDSYEPNRSRLVVNLHRQSAEELFAA